MSLEQIQPIHLAAEGRDAPFRRTMERLDAQGEAIQRHDPSLNLQTRILPDPLLAQLTTYIPDHFEENFRALIVQTKYEQAWRQAEFIFRDSVRVVFSNIERQTRLLPQIAKDTAVIRQQFTSREAFDQRFFERYEDAVRRGLIADLKLQELEAERERQAKELRNLQEQLAVRSSEPVEAQLFKLLEAGDLDAALRLKSQQVQTRREESDRLPRDLFELGTIYELRFEWPQALAAYREAWELRKDPDHGLKYARFAQKLKSFGHATAAYEALLLI